MSYNTVKSKININRLDHIYRNDVNKKNIIYSVSIEIAI